MGAKQQRLDDSNIIFQIERAELDGMAVDMNWWVHCFKEAQKALNIAELQMEHVKFPLSLQIPTTRQFNYRWFNNKTKAHRARRFESIPSGCVMTVPMVITQPGLTPDAVELLMARIFRWWGQWMGISDWGRDFGFGRFDVCYFACKRP